MGALDHAGVDERAQDQVQYFLAFQIAPGRRAGFQAVKTLQIRRAAQAQQRVLRVCGAAQQDDRVARVLEPLSGDVIGPFNEADHRDGWGGVDRAVWTLIVETDIAAGNWGIEGPTGLGQAAH